MTIGRTFRLSVLLSREPALLKTLRSTILFDAAYYQQTNTDLLSNSIDLAKHFFERGACEGRNPHPLFDSKVYLSTYEDVADAGVNPLLHFLQYGAREGRNPHPLFDTKYYIEQHPELADANPDALTHYLTTGWKAGSRPNRFFDPGWYVQQYSDVKASGSEPLSHYVQQGWREGRHPSSDFDPARYCADHNLSDRINPLIHYALSDDAPRSASKTFTMAPVSDMAEADPNDAHAAERPWSQIEQHIDAFISARTSVSQNEAGIFSKESLAHLFGARTRGGGEKFQAAAYWKTYPDIAAVYAKDDAKGMFEHWQKYGFKETRTPFGYCPYTSRRFSKSRQVQNCIDYYGLFSAPTGLGAASRGYLASMQQADWQVRPRNVRINEANLLFDIDDDPRTPGARPTAGIKVNLFNLNADMAHRFFWNRRHELLDDSYNIGLWVWELAHFPPEWASNFGALDEIWVPSEFCRRSISALSPIPVRIIPYVVEANENEELLPRSYFRIPDNVFVFGCMFDVGSLMDRKNPQATIQAFIKAFGDRDDVMLAIKYHEIRHYPDTVPRLRALAAGHGNIRFYGRTFSDRENVSFKLALDCLVSSHRSEGFGLNIAESMLLGKPVIATGYSGNADFVDNEVAFPIDYRLVEVGKQTGPYPPEAVWAEPNVEHLASQMNFVVQNRQIASERGRKAKKRISETYSRAAIGRKINSQFDRLGITDGELGPSVLRAAGINFTYVLPNNSGPKITIIVVVHNTERNCLLRCIESVIAQTYDNLELVLCDDGSDRLETRTILNRFKGVDARIRVILCEKHVGAAAATQSAIEVASGEFVGFLRASDTLDEQALSAVVEAISEHKGADLLYSDENRIAPDGRYCDHHYKPDWSPEHLESTPYLLHFMVVRRAALLAIGGIRERYEGAYDYDVALRVSRAARKIVHVPKILYHHRKVLGLEGADLATEKATEALQDHLKASNREGAVRPGLLPGLFRVRDKLAPGLPVTIAIFTDNRTLDVPGRGHINLFDNFLDSILKKTKTDCSLKMLAVDNGNLSEAQRRFVQSNNGDVISYGGPRRPFNYSQKANFALKHVGTELVVLLNDDMEVISPEWVDALVEFAKRPTTGFVGGKLLFANNRVQHCGMVLGINGHAGHVYHGAPAEVVGYNGYSHIIRNYLAVTGSCMATRMSVLDEIGRFDEALSNDYNDTDLCLRAISAGYRNIYTPFAQLYHFEGITLKRAEPNLADHELFSQRWKRYLDHDPFYNENLTRTKFDFSTRS